MKTIAQRVLDFNKGRLPEMLRIKYKTMRISEFSFYRGTAHLFYEDLPTDSPLFASPNVWLCGDLHLENYGSYKGDNRLAYFDLNDFDEATLAPALFDVARFVTSLFVAAHSLHFDKKTARHLATKFIENYTQTLAQGYIRNLEQATATGLMKQFLDKVQLRSQKEFLMSRVEKGRKLIIIPSKTIKIPKEQRHALAAAVEKWAAKTDNPDFFKVKDAAYRIAGTGSLGVERYVALVKGGNKMKTNVLIDIKECLPSVVERFVDSPQYPPFENEAERTIELQKRIQSVPPALLNTFLFNNKVFVIRELQPTSDKIDFSLFAGKPKKMEDILDEMAQILAWGQLRSGGRQGSTTADALIAFAENAQNWHQPLMDFAEQYARQVQSDFAEYAVAFDKGFFN